MDATSILRAAGLKVTPQRKAVYEAMMELRHAPIESVIERVQARDGGITVSTVYRILDSFCKAGVLGLVSRPDTGKCYYDITATEHHHIFEGKEIVDYMDPELSRLVRQYLHEHHPASGDIDRVQVQIVINKQCLTNKK